VEWGSDVKKVLIKKFGMPFIPWKEIIEKYCIEQLRFKVNYFLDSQSVWRHQGVLRLLYMFSISKNRPLDDIKIAEPITMSKDVATWSEEGSIDKKSSGCSMLTPPCCSCSCPGRAGSSFSLSPLTTVAVPRNTVLYN
jgi:hypothetical protein